MANLRDLVEGRLGAKTEFALNRAGATVGVAAEEVLRNDPRRLAATIVNLSAGAIFVAPGRTVSATSGIRLAPNGGSLALTWDEDFDAVGVEWFGIAELAASAVFTLEELSR